MVKIGFVIWIDCTLVTRFIFTTSTLAPLLSTPAPSLCACGYFFCHFDSSSSTRFHCHWAPSVSFRFLLNSLSLRFSGSLSLRLLSFSLLRLILTPFGSSIPLSLFWLIWTSSSVTFTPFTLFHCHFYSFGLAWISADFYLRFRTFFYSLFCSFHLFTLFPAFLATPSYSSVWIVLFTPLRFRAHSHRPSVQFIPSFHLFIVSWFCLVFGI